MNNCPHQDPDGCCDHGPVVDDSTRVRLLDPSAPNGASLIQWSGTFGEFMEANKDGFDVHDFQVIAGELFEHGQASIGGGAAPLFFLTVNNNPVRP